MALGDVLLDQLHEVLLGVHADDGLGTSRGNVGPEGANKLYVGMLIMLIFSEALALYGLIVALILSQHSYSCS